MMTTAGTTFNSRHDRTRPPHSVCGSDGWSSQGIWRPPTWSTMSAAMEPAQRYSFHPTFPWFCMC
jgi:hypothetical protein